MATTLESCLPTSQLRLARKLQASLCCLYRLQVAAPGDFLFSNAHCAPHVRQWYWCAFHACSMPATTLHEHARSQQASDCPVVAGSIRTKWRDFSGTRTATLKPPPELVDEPFSTGRSRPLRGPNVQQPGHVIVQPLAPACAMCLWGVEKTVYVCHALFLPVKIWLKIE